MGDIRLRRRILGALLDGLCQSRPDLYLATPSQFLAQCADELTLCQDLRILGERALALRRLEALGARLSEYMERIDAPQLRLCRYRCQTQQVRLLMNDSRPAQAAELAQSVSAELDLRRSAGALPQAEAWRSMEIDLRHTHSVALALAGDLEQALAVGERAAEMAASTFPPTEAALDVVSTYANILIAKDPARAEALLRQTDAKAQPFPATGRCRIHVALNLSMSLIVQAWRERAIGAGDGDGRLCEATECLKVAYAIAMEKGRLSDAAAAAVLMGLVYACRRDGAEASWFANAVNAASLSRQMETLWRAHLNLATALARAGGAIERVAEHARAASEILMDTLSPYPQPETSYRYSLIKVPLAHAVRFLVTAGDPAGERTLARLPALLTMFEDDSRTRLRRDRSISHEWLRDGDYDFVLY